MQVSNNIDLFLFCVVEDHRRKSFTEGCGSLFLHEYYHLVKAKKITIYSDQEVVCHDIIRWRDRTLLEKIFSIAQAIIFFIPGILSKAVYWVWNYRYIYQRNQHLIQFLKKQADFENKCDLKPHIIPLKTFSSTEQNESSLIIPSDLFNNIFKFLRNKEIALFAQTSIKHYKVAAEFSKNPLFQCRDLDKVFLNIIDPYVKGSGLPLGVLPSEVYALFLEQQKLLKTKFFSRDELEFLLRFQPNNHLIDSKLFNLMRNVPLKMIQHDNQKILVAKLRDNIDNKERIFIFLKIKSKWAALYSPDYCINTTKQLCAGLWIFLNHMHYHEESPKVVEYLTRLFKGEPCGRFPDELNKNIDIDLSKEDAPDLLNEGPCLCPDGITPVLQLWV